MRYYRQSTKSDSITYISRAEFITRVGRAATLRAEERSLTSPSGESIAHTVKDGKLNFIYWVVEA